MPFRSSVGPNDNIKITEKKRKGRSEVMNKLDLEEEYYCLLGCNPV
jgi:hypothetical protein